MVGPCPFQNFPNCACLITSVLHLAGDLGNSPSPLFSARSRPFTSSVPRSDFFGVDPSHRLVPSQRTLRLPFVTNLRRHLLLGRKRFYRRRTSCADPPPRSAPHRDPYHYSFADRLVPSFDLWLKKHLFWNPSRFISDTNGVPSFFFGTGGSASWWPILESEKPYSYKKG